MSETTLTPETSAAAVAGDRAEPAAESKPEGTASPTSTDKSITRGVILRRPELVHGTTPGTTVEYNKFPTDREKLPKEKEVVIKPETVAKYNMELRTFVTDMNTLAEKPAPAGSSSSNLLEHLLANPDRKSDKLIMDQLSKRVVGDDGITIIQEVDEDGLAQFLTEGKERNWAVATALIEQQALFGLMAGGIDATLKSPFYNRKLAETTQNENPAILDKISTARRIAKTGLSKAYLGVLAAGYFAAGSGTTELKFTEDIEMLANLKLNSTPDELAYLEARTGIDLNRISIAAPVVPGGRWAVAGVDGYSSPTRDNKARTVAAISARNEFLKQLNIDEPPSKHLGIEVDRSIAISFPEEFIFDGTKDPEGLSIRYSMDIMKAYSEIVSPTANKYDRLIAMAKAREKVMVGYLETQAAVENAGNGKAENMAALEGKKDKMKNHAEELTTEQRTELDKIKAETAEKLGKAKTKKAELVDPLPEKTQAVMALETQLLVEFGLPISENFESTVTARVDKLKEDLDKAKASLKLARQNKADALAGHSDKIIAKFGEHTAAIKALADKLGSGSGGGGKDAEGKGKITVNIPPAPNFDKLIEQYTLAENTRHDGIIDDAKTDFDALKTELEKIETKQREYQQAVHDREMATITIASREPGQLKNGADALNQLTSGTSPVFTVVELRTLTVNKLVEKLAAKIKDPEERLKLALDAKAEALGSQEHIPDYQLEALTEVTQPWTGIKADDLFRSIGEMGMILQAATGMSADEAREDILNARHAAEKMLQARHKARGEQEIAYYEEVIKDADKKIEKLGDFKSQISELDATITVMQKQEKAFKKSYELADSTEGLESLSSDTKVNATDLTYSEAERTAGVEKGYYEWLRLLHPDYTKAGPERDEIFEAFHRVLPPEKLAELLNENLSLGFVGKYKLSEVLNEINPAAKRLSGPDIQRTVKQLINYVTERGLAI